jgi:NAD(P)-dependent dehydrogenase (short-subunit alcohol dehydrogenase family)
LIARRPGPLHALAAEIASAGGRARSAPCDVTDRAALEDALAGGALMTGASLVVDGGWTAW